MGIFSFLKKKNAAPAPAAGANSQLRSGEPSRPMTDAERARQRDIARATAAKIDAIEAAMASDIFNEPEPTWGSQVRRTARTNAQIEAERRGLDTLPPLELATTELLADEISVHATAAPRTAPVIEEIAILYANAQGDMAEQLLVASLADVGQAERAVWWLLFDLYQASGQQDAFDNIAIDYASRFETSAPAWTPLPQAGLGPGLERRLAGVIPTESLGALLDDSIAPQLQRLLERAAGSPATRLELGRVDAVTAHGCARLLTALGALRGNGRELILAGAAELADTLRASLAIGQRDASEAPWLLLLELLQLMHREKEFEETAMDYCVTYERSPPSFEAPINVATAAAQAPSRADRFMLPTLIDGACAPLFDAIDAYAEHYQPLVLDCARLARVDYSAAGVLLKRLRTLAEAGKSIELRDLNHLVAALFKLMGYAQVARLFPHKY
ncbi:MAG: STAS domain-containing protein [Massilia sp.]|nr:STAS domain-containing protein [Massilia sp.]